MLLPELAGPKCLNGVSWLMYETPMLLLDESATCFDISLQEDSVTLDLLTYVVYNKVPKFTILNSRTSRTREFTCSWPPGSEKMPVPPESPIVNDFPDDNRSNWNTTITSSSSENLPTTRTNQNPPTATIVLAGGLDLAQTPPDDTALIGVSFPLPTYTPHWHELSIRELRVTANLALNSGPASWIESDPLNKPHSSYPTIPEIGLQFTETVESTTKHASESSDKAEIKQIQDTKALQDTFIPSTVPEEIQAIIDSYLSGRPLLLVISYKRFFDYWSLRLPKEFRFLMLGYFRILGVQVLTSSSPQFLC